MAASDLGIRIRRARERKRWSQRHLAAVIGVGVRSVGRWERGEAVPRNAIGALEDVLGSLAAEPDTADAYPDPDEAFIWSQTRFKPGERRAMIDALRRDRGGTG